MIKNFKSFFLPFLCLVLFSYGLNAQIDTTKKSELRVSYFGVSPFPIYIDGYGGESENFFNPTFSYLRRINESKLFFVTEVSAFVRSLQNVDDHFEGLEDEGRSKYGLLYLGLEKQHQFKYFGIFWSAGIRGGISKFNGDFNVNSDEPLIDLELKQFQIGPTVKAIALINLSENVFIYASSAINVYHKNIRYNQRPANDCCGDVSVFDTNFNIIEAVGLSFKF